MQIRYVGALLLVCVLAACTSAPTTSPGAMAGEPDSSESVGVGEPSPSASTPSSSASHPLAGEDAWIAYQTNKGGGEGVWLIRPGGTDDHEVALKVPGDHLHPDWSPDGTRLVITSREAKDTLFDLDVATDEARVLWECADPCVGDDEAVWSPNGSRIAFVRAMEPLVNGIPSCALMVGDPVTGDVEPLTGTKSCSDRETFPHWSQDGSRVAYYRGVYVGDTTESTALYVVDVATGIETKLTEGDLFAGDSDWSAGDDWIVFSTYPLNDFQCCQVSNLYRIQPDGSGLEQLTDETSPDVRLTQPRFTPDGERLVVTGVTSKGRELWILPADATGEPIVVSPGGIFTHGTWQPT
jgi:Tol biopolymer transport system component